MFPLRLPGAMPLGLLATLITACPAPSSPSPAPAPTTPTAPPVAPDWLDPLAEITLTLPGPGWTKKTSEEVGGTVGVTLTNQGDCRGRLWRTRVPPQAAADRQAALDARIMAELKRLGVSDVVVIDQGEVPHGDFRARLVQARGVLMGAPYHGRAVGTFVTRPSGRFYVQITASSTASSSVTRRTCFDTVTASFTIEGDGR